MKLYRIVTENKNYNDILVYLMEHKLDATIIQANGLWQGRAEKSIVIEIVINSPVALYRAIENLVFWLKKHNKQEAVMLQVLDADVKLI